MLRKMAITMSMPETNKSSPPPDGSMSPALELEYLSRIVFLVVPAKKTPGWLEDHVAECFKCGCLNLSPSSMICSALRCC